MLWRIFPFSFPSSKLVDNIDLFRGEIIWNCYIGAWRDSSLFFLCFSFCLFLHNMLLDFAVFRFLLQLIEPIHEFLCMFTFKLNGDVPVIWKIYRYFPVSSVCTESMSFRRMCNGTNMPKYPAYCFFKNWFILKSFLYFILKTSLQIYP